METGSVVMGFVLEALKLELMMSSVVEGLPSICEALDSTPKTMQKITSKPIL